MDRLQWIKELVIAEQQMEEAGMVDFNAGYDPQRELEEATVDYLLDLKTAFVEAASSFNQLKGSLIGNLKIYGISKTKADFMLFRNGHKLIFSMKYPGAIFISQTATTAQFIPGSQPSSETAAQEGSSEQLRAKWGAFGDLAWTYNDQEVRIGNMVRFYMSRFVKESAK